MTVEELYSRIGELVAPAGITSFHINTGAETEFTENDAHVFARALIRFYEAARKCRERQEKFSA